jgi:hypothetical protein
MGMSEKLIAIKKAFMEKQIKSILKNSKFEDVHVGEGAKLYKFPIIIISS